MQQPEDFFEIDIPEENLEPGPECCIYKVPKRLREVKETAYTPQLISVGPVHHGNTNLAKMEWQKLRYYKKFRKRISEETLDGFRSYIRENLIRIYRCYDEFVFETEFEASKFETIVLKDAVFIIELFLRSFEEKEDFLLNREWLSLELRVDLILLENQLPFFVLKDLCNLAFDSSDTHRPSFLDLTCAYFGLYEYLADEREINHFTDLVRCVLVTNHPSNSDVKIDKVYSATMLHEAGVDFIAVEDTDWLLDVRFKKGKLQIPTFHMVQIAEAVIRNLIALEQCHYPKKAYFCSYIQLLDRLVDTDKDVDLLVKKGIFVNGMGSSAALADMINTLMVGVAEIPPSYDKIGNDLNRYHNSSWNRTTAALRHVYFNSLLRGTATIAAFILVLLALTQTVLAILDRAMAT